jgi:orotate phosphoribosyltransferase
MGEMISSDPERPDILCGVPAAGLAIATAISLETGIPAIHARKEPTVYKELSAYLNERLMMREEEGGFTFDEKTGIESAIEIISSLSGLKAHGIGRYVDGEYKDNVRMGIVDDVITTSESKLEARDLILLDAKRTNRKVSVVGVYVLLDREQGGREALQREGLKLHSVATITEAVKWLHESAVLNLEMYDTIVKYTNTERGLSGLK